MAVREAIVLGIARLVNLTFESNSQHSQNDRQDGTALAIAGTVLVR